MEEIKEDEKNASFFETFLGHEPFPKELMVFK